MGVRVGSQWLRMAGPHGSGWLSGRDLAYLHVFVVRKSARLRLVHGIASLPCLRLEAASFVDPAMHGPFTHHWRHTARLRLPRTERETWREPRASEKGERARALAMLQ